VGRVAYVPKGDDAAEKAALANCTPNCQPSVEWRRVAGLAIVFGSAGTTCLVAQERTHALMGISVTVAAISLPAFYFLTRAWGPSGAAAANALSETIVAALSWYA